VLRALPLFLALFVLLAGASLTEALPGADVSRTEARTLMTARSVAQDGDLDLHDEYAARAWREVWDGGPLEPAALPTDGRIHERQGVALPLLLAPGWALGGVTGVRLELCALLALTLTLAAGLGRRLVPDPWPLRGVALVAVSSAALGAAGAVSAAVPAALLLVLGARSALWLRDRPSVRPTAGAAACAAALPWLDPWLVLPAAALALVTLRWLRNRRRGLAGFVGLEVVLLSGVVYVSINDVLFGGPTPGAAALPGSRGPAVDALALACALPVAGLAAVAAWRLWVSRRDRLVLVADDQVDVEVAATFLLGLVVVVGVTAGASGAPELAVVAAGPLAALAAWALPVVPARAGAALAAVVAGASVAVAVAG
jgi:hypothetical protein